MIRKYRAKNKREGKFDGQGLVWENGPSLLRKPVPFAAIETPR